MTPFPEKIPIFTPKISDDLFFSHPPGFYDFTFLYSIKCRIRPFLHQKNHYFGKEFLDSTIFLLCSYWRPMHGPSPPQILGEPSPPSSPRSPHLRWCGGRLVITVTLR